MCVCVCVCSDRKRRKRRSPVPNAGKTRPIIIAIIPSSPSVTTSFSDRFFQHFYSLFHLPSNAPLVFFGVANPTAQAFLFMFFFFFNTTWYTFSFINTRSTVESGSRSEPRLTNDHQKRRLLSQPQQHYFALDYRRCLSNPFLFYPELIFLYSLIFDDF